MPVELNVKRPVGRPKKEEAKAHDELQDLLKRVETVPELVEIIQEGLARRNQADEMEDADGAQGNQAPDAPPPWMVAFMQQQTNAIQSLRQDQEEAIRALRQELQ